MNYYLERTNPVSGTLYWLTPSGWQTANKCLDQDLEVKSWKRKHAAYRRAFKESQTHLNVRVIEKKGVIMKYETATTNEGFRALAVAAAERGEHELAMRYYNSAAAKTIGHNKTYRYQQSAAIQAKLAGIEYDWMAFATNKKGGE